MNKKSFTLIELLVVIAIVGILSSLVIARFSNWNDNARIANTLQWSAGVHRKLGSNLVGHWLLNGDTKDISGYGNHGVVAGSPDWVSGVPGTGNQALNFEVIDDYITVPHSDSFTVEIISWSFWIKRARFIGNGGPIHKYEVADGLRSWNMRQEGDGRLGMTLSSNGIGSAGSSSGINLLENNVWLHIAITYDKGDLTWYKNGSYHSESINSQKSLYNNFLQPLEFGRYRTNAFEGDLADVRIYDTALTAEEVGRIYAESRDKYLVDLD